MKLNESKNNAAQELCFACDRKMKRFKQKKKKLEIPDDDNNANVETENKTTK